MIKKPLLLIISFSFYIASATKLLPPNITIFKIATQEPKTVFYNNGNLYLRGFKGPGAIEIYSIIGNKITNKNIRELDVFKFTYPLDSGNMYIIRVVTGKEVTTFKVVAS